MVHVRDRDRDMYGEFRRRAEEVEIRGMMFPVRCTYCGRVYDVGSVTVTARYADCSVWTSPCCHRQVDDRPAGWKSRADIERLY